MQEKKYNDTKKEIRSVLLTYQKGARLDEFLKSYKQLLGMRLPSNELGFRSDLEFLRSMPDVVLISTNDVGRVHLFGVADEASEHIKKLVSRQRTTRPKKSLKYLSKPKIFRTESNIKEISKYSNPSFVPGALRAEILQLLCMYPDGITFPAFVLAYRKLFNKYLSLEKGLETLENIISAIPELEIRDNKHEKKIYVRNIQTKNTSTADKDMENRFSVQKDSKSSFVKVHRTIASSNFDKSGISDAVKKNLQLVLDKCPDGILAIHFPPLYEKITKEPFVLHELGYNSILELVDALPNIFTREVDPSDEKNWFILPSKTHASFKSKYITKSEDASVHNGGQSSPKVCEGIPVDAASPFSQYMQPRIPENVNLEEYVPIFVSAIVNPSLFWFQLQTDEVIKDFEELENNLGKFYNSYASAKYKMNPAHIVIGASCVIQCPEDRQWYRAVIKSIPSIELVNVLFVDYGSRENIPRSTLRYVKEKFFHFPAHAFRAELSGLKPCNNASFWDVRSQQRFIKLCESAFIMAYLKPLTRDSFSTFLCDTSREDDLHFDDVLINEGYAELSCDTPFNGNNAVSHSIHSVSVDKNHKEFDENHTGTFDTSTSSDCNSPHVSTNYIESSKANFQPNAADLKVKRKLSFSLERKEPETTCIKEYCSKRYVKKVKLCEEIKFFVINMKTKPYICGGDLTKLFWNDKDHSFLAERLNYKDVVVPTIQLSRENNIDFYKQCEWFRIPDCENFANNDFALTLYPLEWAFNILNVFGHPSVCLRLAIQNEIKIFDPTDPIWNGFHYDKETWLEDLEAETEAKLGKLCLYDLKAKSEALRIKRLKLLKVGSSSPNDEIAKIESLQQAVERRIAQIESICSQFASCS